MTEAASRLISLATATVQDLKQFFHFLCLCGFPLLDCSPLEVQMMEWPRIMEDKLLSVRRWQDGRARCQSAKFESFILKVYFQISVHFKMKNQLATSCLFKRGARRRLALSVKLPLPRLLAVSEKLKH